MASRKPSLIVVPQQPLSRPPDPEVLPKASRLSLQCCRETADLDTRLTPVPNLDKLVPCSDVKDCTLTIWSPGGAYARRANSRRLLRSRVDPNRLRQIRWLRNRPTCARRPYRLQARFIQAELIIDVQKSSAAAWGASSRTDTGRTIIIEAVDDLATRVGVADACRVLGVPRSSHYRARQTSPTTPPVPLERPASARALSERGTDRCA